MEFHSGRRGLLLLSVSRFGDGHPSSEWTQQSLRAQTKQWFQQALPTADDFENWMNQKEPTALKPIPTWYIGPA